jgi:hypothetical protein
MRQRSSMILALATFTVALSGPWAFAAEPAAAKHLIPQSLIVEHKDTLDRLTVLASRRGEVGVAARKALALFKAHSAREEEFILPPLTLLPDLADGKVTPDMAWALAMTDRVKAERDQIYQEHVQVTDAMTALYNAGQRAKDKEAIDFAQAGVADSLNDMELLEPMVIMIGDYLHSKLPSPK